MNYYIPWENTYPTQGGWGSATAKGLGGLGNQIRSACCRMYKRYPPSLIPTPGDSFLRGFWDTICEDPPPPPTPPFQGGQCCDVIYLVESRWTLYDTGGARMAAGIHTGNLAAEVYGAILGVEIINDPPWVGWGFKSRRCDGTIYFGQRFFTSGNPGSIDFEFLSVTRKDGQPDTCGNPPDEWIPLPPPLTDNELNWTFQLIGINNVVNNLSFTFNQLNLEANIAPHFSSSYFDIHFSIGGIEIAPPNSPVPPLIPMPPSLIPPYPFPRIPFLQPPLPPIDINANLNISFQNELNIGIGNVTQQIEDNSQNIITQIEETNINVDTKIETTKNELTGILSIIQNLLDDFSDSVDYSEMTDIVYNDGNCNGGIWEDNLVSRSVPKLLEPILAPLFENLARTRKEVCEKEEAKIIGLPLPYYETNTSRCATLYYGFSPPRGVTVGRYLNIPNPNLDLLIEEAKDIPPYRPGKYTCYTQYLSQKGNKIQVFGNNPVDCDNYRILLERFTLFEEKDIYFRAPVKEVQPRYNYELKLRRITYFPERVDRYSGNDLGEIIWEKRRPYDS